MDGSRSEILLCFPAAGGGPSFFAPWSGASSVFDVVPIDLPGKEKLLFEEPVDSIPGLARAVLPAVRAAVAGRRRIVLFGHCFGAIVAYELARLLELKDGDAELVLFASGSAAPGDPLDPRGRSVRRGPAAPGRAERRGVGVHPRGPRTA